MCLCAFCGWYTPPSQSSPPLLLRNIWTKLFLPWEVLPAYLRLQEQLGLSRSPGDGDLQNRGNLQHGSVGSINDSTAKLCVVTQCAWSFPKGSCMCRSNVPRASSARGLRNGTPLSFADDQSLTHLHCEKGAPCAFRLCNAGIKHCDSSMELKRRKVN